jgi:cytochrome oxidase Cu insertion factor (SCO1/SenC/PrrC family)
LLTALLLALCASVAGCRKLETRSPSIERAAVAPDFELVDTEGRKHSLDQLVANGPAVVVFYRGFW